MSVVQYSSASLFVSEQGRTEVQKMFCSRRGKSSIDECFTVWKTRVQYAVRLRRSNGHRQWKRRVSHRALDQGIRQTLVPAVSER